MKRFYNKSVCGHWHQVQIPNHLHFRWWGGKSGPDWIQRWCWDHDSPGRWHRSPYTGLWFERREDLEQFQKILTWRMLQS